MEIELKLAMLPGHVVRLRRHSLLKIVKPCRQVLLSVYFDTPAFDLMRRGIALRMRRIDAQWVQTLKAESKSVGALTSRPEWEVVVTDDRPDFSLLPLAALDMLRGIRLDRVTPVFITEFQRITWLIGEQGTQVEVALDQGKIYTDTASRQLCEVEIELKSGSSAMLFDVAEQLLQRVPLQVEPRSKAQRGYILCGAIQPMPIKTTAPMITTHQSAGEAWHAMLQAALVQLTGNVPGFLEQPHEIEYLHQLRVAVRRLLSGAALAKSLGQPMPGWRRSLRKLMTALNTARDWDVFLQQTLPTILPVANISLDHDVVDEPVQDALRKIALQARQHAQNELSDPAITGLILEIGRALLILPAEVAWPDAKTWTQAILDRRWRKLRERCVDFTRLNSAERHQTRIAAKKLRYLADACAVLYGDKCAAHFITALAALQDELGYANDLTVGRRLLRGVPQRSAAVGFAIGCLYGILACNAGQYNDVDGKNWDRLVQMKLFWR
ncbi:MAG: CHAD domain-containing protein [Nitrosomonas sp.]|nr:MAG: CHAD domain-containing protein [Nitrosomonas sp.]